MTCWSNLFWWWQLRAWVLTEMAQTFCVYVFQAAKWKVGQGPRCTPHPPPSNFKCLLGTRPSLTKEFSQMLVWWTNLLTNRTNYFPQILIPSLNLYEEMENHQNGQKTRVIKQRTRAAQPCKPVSGPSCRRSWYGSVIPCLDVSVSLVSRATLKPHSNLQRSVTDFSWNRSPAGLSATPQFLAPQCPDLPPE